MRTKIISLVFLSLVASSATAQGIKINPGTVLKANAGIKIVLQNGGLTNNGNADLSNGDLYMVGGSQAGIGGTSGATVSNLYINKSSSSVLLNSNLNVINTVVFQNGLLDLNGNNLSLSPAGSLVGETEVNHITGAAGGYVTVTVNL